MKFYNYDEKEKRIEVFGERWYYREEKKKFYRNVTTILGIINKGYNYDEWLKNVGHNAEIIVDRAGKFGTAVHHLIELFLHKEEVSFNELAMQYGQEVATVYWLRFMVWFEFWKEFNLKNKVEYKDEGIEYITYSDKYEYAGTIDLIATINGEIQLFDWKTGNNLGTKEESQMVAYMNSLTEGTGQEIKKANLVWMPTKYINQKGYRIIEVKNSQEDFELFLATKRLFDRDNKDKAKFLSYPTSISINDIKGE